MSLISRNILLSRARRGKAARRRLVASHIDKGIASQIRATREEQGMTQAELARQAEMSQNNISRLEAPDYGKHTITSLKRIADALDVALVVRFVPFSQYIDWLSGTPHWDDGLSSKSLAVSDFSREEVEHRLDFPRELGGIPNGDAVLIQFPVNPHNFRPVPVQNTPQGTQLVISGKQPMTVRPAI